MTVNFISPVGRLVQGGVSLNDKVDDDGKKVIDPETGLQIKECFIALAIAKTDPELPAFYANFVAAAHEAHPTIVAANGACSHPKFSWKIQDGDGVDSNGKSVADKPGFAGHYIFKMSTRYLPRCFHYGKYDPSQQIQNAHEVIKKGYYIRVSGITRGNGVALTEVKKVPGIFVSPDLIELVGYGPEIVTGPDANKVFGGAAITHTPAGMSATPTVAPAAPSNGLSPPPMPGAAPALPALPGAAALPALPTLPGAAPALPALPAVTPAMPAMPAMSPVAPAAPQYAMTASAMGFTREQMITQGWNDDALIAQGHMVRIA